MKRSIFAACVAATTMIAFAERVETELDDEGAVAFALVLLEEVDFVEFCGAFRVVGGDLEISCGLFVNVQDVV